MYATKINVKAYTFSNEIRKYDIMMHNYFESHMNFTNFFESGSLYWFI
jgi:hypothetical protein